MAKKNIGGGVHRFKLGNDSWDKDIRSDITDVTSTLLSEGYFTGEHRIFANRNPTPEDISATLDGVLVNFEKRKWSWVNTITNEIFSLRTNEAAITNIPNGGLDTDWINSTSGLAEDWVDFSGFKDVGYTYSIVTGNGFTGNAQRVETILDTYPGGFSSTPVDTEIGTSYTIHFKYRSNNAMRIMRNDSDVVGYGIDTAGELVTYSVTFIATTATTNIHFRVASAPVAGDYIEVDEVYIETGVIAVWEKFNDLSLATVSDVDGSVYISEDGKLRAISTTSGYIYVDGNRTDDYIENGSIFMPYKTLKAVIDAGHNNTTVVVSEGTYDAGETLILPDSLNLRGTSIDNTFIAANITFTNITGMGQLASHIGFTGNVTQVINSWVIYERCTFTGVGNDIILGGAKCSIKDSTFDAALNSIALNNNELYIFNSKFRRTVTITGDETILSNCVMDDTITHSSGQLILNNTQLKGAVSLVSNATENSSTPLILAGVIYMGTIVLNDAYANISNTLAVTGAAITGTNITVNLLSGTNTIPYTPTEDYHPTTKKYVDDKVEVIQFAVSDETTGLTVGTSKIIFRMPFAMVLTEVRASVSTAPTDANIIVDINESGTTVLSTKLSIDATEKTSTTATTQAVISDPALADDAEITVDIDQIGSTIVGTGLKVILIGKRV